MSAGKTIKVMLVDDSAVVRQTLSDILNTDPQITVQHACADPFVAARKMREQVPDVIVLDIEMPRMDGITFLKKIMSQHPIPVIICSSLVEAGSRATLKALEYGALEIIQKPSVGTKKFLEESRVQLIDSVKAAARASVRKIAVQNKPVTEKLSADAVVPASNIQPTRVTTDRIIVIGASTGGTEAVREVLQALPADVPGIVIVQHMPAGFTTSFAQRLDECCALRVTEAKDGDVVERGQALIAPGGLHTLLKRSGDKYYVEVKQGPLVSRHRPSVDVLFRSAALYAGKNATAAILTGMGDDGAAGMKELHDTGAFTIAQNEDTCVVYGMPAMAVKRGGVDVELPLQSIAQALLNRPSVNRSRRSAVNG